jgi:hypothetical protein
VLRPLEIPARDAERLVVDPKPVLHQPELLVRRLVGAVRALSRRIEALQLSEDTLGLRTFRADLVRVSTRGGGPEQTCQKQASHKCRKRNKPPRHSQ